MVARLTDQLPGKFRRMAGQELAVVSSAITVVRHVLPAAGDDGDLSPNQAAGRDNRAIVSPPTRGR